MGGTTGTTIGVGLVLEGKYRVLEELGSGSMGLVFSAVHERLKRKLAIKTLRPEISRDSDVVERFQQEARAAGAMGHPNIVQIFDAGCTPDGSHYIVMEYLEGHSLEDEIANNPMLPPDRAAIIALQTLSGLAAAHRRGIVHRDLKPANIYVSKADDMELVKILDFGISKILESNDPMAGGAKNPSSGTKAGTILGTPLYMSPEQARGTNVDLRTDIWSMGAVLYEMLCGVPPFNFDHPIKVLNAILDGKFPPPRSIRSSVPQPLEAVVLRAMQFKQNDRFPDANAMGMALKQALQAIAPAGSQGVSAEGTGPILMSPAPQRSAPAAGVGLNSEEIRLMSALENISEDSLTGGSDPDAPIPTARGTVAGPTIAKKAAAQPAANPVIPDRSKEAKKGVAASHFEPPSLDSPHENLQLDRAPARGGPVFDRGPGVPRRAGMMIQDFEKERARKLRISTVFSWVFLLLFVGAAGAYLYRYHRLGYWGLEPPPAQNALLHFHISPNDAEILVEGDPINERPLPVRIGLGRNYTFQAPGRLSVRRYIETTSRGAAHVQLRLPLAMPPLEPEAGYDLDLMADTDIPAKIEDIEQLEIASHKLSLYEQCSRAIATPLNQARATYERVADSLRSGPSIQAVPSEAIGECRSTIAGAEEQKPPMPGLQKTAHDYLESLKILGPASRDLKDYLDKRMFEKDGFAAGARFKSILDEQFTAVEKLHRKYNSELLAARTGLQKLELQGIKAKEGQSLHAHVRSVALASQELALALEKRSATRLHEEKRKALETELNAARDFLAKNPGVMQTAPAAEPFLNSIPAMLKAQPGQGITWHNQSLEMFNRIVLP